MEPLIETKKSLTKDYRPEKQAVCESKTILKLTDNSAPGYGLMVPIIVKHAGWYNKQPSTIQVKKV